MTSVAVNAIQFRLMCFQVSTLQYSKKHEQHAVVKKGEGSTGDVSSRYIELFRLLEFNTRE